MCLGNKQTRLGKFFKSFDQLGNVYLLVYTFEIRAWTNQFIFQAPEFQNKFYIHISHLAILCF